jgi:predicted DNA binding CopG/RHH family protein
MTFDIFIVMIKNRKIIIRITESQLAKIVDESKRQKMNKSTLMREVLDEYFERISSESIINRYKLKKELNS